MCKPSLNKNIIFQFSSVSAKTGNNSFIKRSGRMTTWKQIRTLRSLAGKPEDKKDRSKSLPELTANR